MSNFIHAREYLSAGDTVVIKITHQCHVRLMDDGNFQKYQNGLKHAFVGGGPYKQSPITIKVPHLGFWNVAIDLGAGKSAAGVKYNISFLKQP